mmetsp:Transcript_3698/g.10918  ORF Transcript_3698/g.10918 Transcript_3698/m.10918 type:complete len:131 (+) Transcript_3698:297-689(+)
MYLKVADSGAFIVHWRLLVFRRSQSLYNDIIDEHCACDPGVITFISASVHIQAGVVSKPHLVSIYRLVSHYRLDASRVISNRRLSSIVRVISTRPAAGWFPMRLFPFNMAQMSCVSAKRTFRSTQGIEVQ